MATTKRLLLGLMFGIATGGTVAAQAQRIPTRVEQVGTDRVGPMLASDVKETIARSARFEISPNPIAEISLVSVDVDVEPSDNGNRSAVSAQYRAALLCKSKDGKDDLQIRMTHSVFVVG